MIEQLADPVEDGQAWARRQQDAFSPWVMNFGGGDAGRWDFGLDSLNVLSYIIFDRFPTTEMIENPDNAAFTEPAAWYLGEIVRRTDPKKLRWTRRDYGFDAGHYVVEPTAKTKAWQAINPRGHLGHVLYRGDPLWLRSYYLPYVAPLWDKPWPAWIHSSETGSWSWDQAGQRWCSQRDQWLASIASLLNVLMAQLPDTALDYSTESLEAVEIFVVTNTAARGGQVRDAIIAYVGESQKWSRWLVPLLYLIPGVWNLVDGDTRKGALWAGFALYFAVYLNVWSYRTRQVSDHVSQLRAAAVKVPEAAGVLAETAGGAHLPPRWQWQSLPLVVVSVAFFVVAGYFWGAPTLSHSSAHHQDCERVPQVYEFVNRHPEMLNAERIMPGDPGLPAYQEWANQLHTFAGSVHWSALAQHLDRVADLATHAVSVVNATRESPNPQASAHSHEADYQNTATAIVTELGEAITVCRRDS